MAVNGRHHRVKLSRAIRIAEGHVGLRSRFDADPHFLDQLARRLAAACGLPLAVARRRIEQMAISARPRPSGGFQDRG